MPTFKDKDDEKKDEKNEKKDSKKGKEPWRHKAVTGKDHPDNNPPVSKVAEITDENKKKYEDSINAEREKLYAKADDSDNEEEENDKKK